MELKHRIQPPNPDRAMSPHAQMHALDRRADAYTVSIMTLEGKMLMENVSVYSHLDGWLQIECVKGDSQDHDSRVWFPMANFIITVHRC